MYSIVTQSQLANYSIEQGMFYSDSIGFSLFCYCNGWKSFLLLEDMSANALQYSTASGDHWSPSYSGSGREITATSNRFQLLVRALHDSHDCDISPRRCYIPFLTATAGAPDLGQNAV